MKKQHLNIFGLILLVTAVLIGLTSCDDGTTPTGEGVVFLMPSDPSPANLSTDQELSNGLHWSDCCADGDGCWYAVYFGTDDDSLRLIGQTSGTFYPLPLLEPNTTYFWRIDVHRDALIRKSPVWCFTTGLGLIYPLHYGATWRYEREVHYTNFSVDSMAQYFPDVYDTLQVQVTQGGGTLDDPVIATVVEEWLNCGMLGCYSSSYFENRSDGLYYHGSDGYYSSIVPHKPTTVSLSSTGTASFQPCGVVPDGGLMSQGLLAEPLRSIAYPVYLGSEWTMMSAEDSDAGWTITKEVTNFVQAGVPAGSFPAFEIRRYWDKDGDGLWDDDISMVDYIAKEGLLARRGTYRGVTIDTYYSTTPGDGGTCDITETYLLIGYDL